MLDSQSQSYIKSQKIEKGILSEVFFLFLCFLMNALVITFFESLKKHQFYFNFYLVYFIVLCFRNLFRRLNVFLFPTNSCPVIKRKIENT